MQNETVSPVESYRHKIIFENNKRAIKTDNHSLTCYNNDRLSTECALNLINKYTQKHSTIITTDVGQHQILASKIFESNTPQNFITSGGLGTMGFGLPAAIGAKIAKPDTIVINITGDGSFQMNMQELGTAIQYNIPLKIIIMNNSSLGLIKQTQIKQYSNRICHADLVNPNFATLASAYGIKGITIKTPDELEDALKNNITSNESIIFDIYTSKAEIV